MHVSQTQTSIRSDLIVRPAQPSDRAALEAIAVQTWDGEDYLAGVLDDWYADPDGGFFVATLHDQVVGVAKITKLGRDEWWLEGLRVAPNYQGQGIARILHHFSINQVRQLGAGTVRFSTASVTKAVHVLAEETGFERVASFALYAARPLDEPVEGLRKLSSSDITTVRSWLEGSSHYEIVQHTMVQGWTWTTMTDERLITRLALGRVYGWYEAGETELAGVVILNPLRDDADPAETALEVAYLDAVPGDLEALARDVRRLASKLGHTGVRIKVFSRPERLAVLEKAGYLQEWDAEAWLYSRDVALTAQADVRTEEIPPID